MSHNHVHEAAAGHPWLPEPGEGSVRKVFIVARERPDLYVSLSKALESEGDVFVIYDRRARAEPRQGRRGWRSVWSASELAFEPGDRRRRTDVDDEIRERGFGVVHLTRYDDHDYADEEEPLDPLHDD